MLSIPNFADRLCDAVKGKESILCAGLDPQLRYMPPHLIHKYLGFYHLSLQSVGRLFYDFNCAIIEALHDLVACVKLNMAFYEQYGSEGVRAFEDTVRYAQDKSLLVIADAKRGDGGDTADAYADGYIGEVPFFGIGSDPTLLSGFFSYVRSDCMTVNPYIGEDCVGRFVKRVKEYGNGIFVVVKTSFKPNSVFENLMVVQLGIDSIPVWQEVAGFVDSWGEGTEGAYGLRNVGVVLGATYPEDAPKMRKILPNSIFLKPGYGGQGADAKDAVAGIRPDGFGVIVNNSRNLIYAWQNKKGKYQCEPEKFAEAARLQAIDNRDELANACKEAGNWPF